MSRIGSPDRLARFLDEVARRTRKRFDEIREMVAAGREGLEPRQRTTLDSGSWLVLGTQGLGLQGGRWSTRSGPVAAAVYVSWVLADSVATVQETRRPR